MTDDRGGRPVSTCMRHVKRVFFVLCSIHDSPEHCTSLHLHASCKMRILCKYVSVIARTLYQPSGQYQYQSLHDGAADGHTVYISPARRYICHRLPGVVQSRVALFMVQMQFVRRLPTIPAGAAAAAPSAATAAAAAGTTIGRRRSDCLDYMVCLCIGTRFFCGGGARNARCQPWERSAAAGQVRTLLHWAGLLEFSHCQPRDRRAGYAWRPLCNRREPADDGAYT